MTFIIAKDHQHRIIVDELATHDQPHEYRSGKHMVLRSPGVLLAAWGALANRFPWREPMRLTQMPFYLGGNVMYVVQ